MTTRSGYQPLPVNTRIRLSGLWTALLFVFAYVDVFSLYRSDIRADIEGGRIGGFSIDETFLLVTTIYVAIPSLMVFGALVLRPSLNRVANVVLSIVFALTIVGGAVDQWGYYLLGSAIEVVLLAAIAYHAWTWPRLAPSAAPGTGEAA